MVKELWCYIENMIEKQLNSQKILTNHAVRNPKRIENVIVLITKQYIYKMRCIQKAPSIQALENVIKLCKNVEAEIAQAKGKLDAHAQKWLNITF